MNNFIFKALGIASITLFTTGTHAQEPVQHNYKASYIEMTAADGQTWELAEFLAGAAPLVKQTEPGTALWFALEGPESKLAIFDIFIDENARTAHFSGAIAAALNDNAAKLVKGGWEKGVVTNIRNSTVLSAKAPDKLYTATTATYIKLTAAQNQGDALAQLLTAAGPLVTKTEPKTLYWVALRLDEQNFAIFDVFKDNWGREAHFAGQVAGLLQTKADELVEGGWNDGVVANVHNFNILAIK